jgi:hypothetical protein
VCLWILILCNVISASAQSTTITPDKLVVRPIAQGTITNDVDAVRIYGGLQAGVLGDVQVINPDGTISVAAALADGSITFAKWHDNGCLNNEVPVSNGTLWSCGTLAGLGGLQASDSPTITGDWRFSTKTVFGDAVTPQQLLHLYKSGADVGLRLQTASTWDLTASGANLLAAIGGSTIWTANATGLGILKTPGTALDVNGTTTTVNLAVSSSVASHLIPSQPDTYNLGAPSTPWKTGYLSTLAAVLFSESTATLFGGYSIIGKDAGTFGAAVSSGAVTIDFGKAMTPGHWILVRAHDTAGTVRSEYILVGALTGGTTYAVTRDLAGASSPDPAWADGTPFLVLGAVGDGRIELHAYTTPRITIYTQGATYNTQTTRAVFGNLNGSYGYGTDIYGVGMGDPSATNVTVDETNGFRVRYGTTNKFVADTSGNLSLVGNLTMSSPGVLTAGNLTINSSGITMAPNTGGTYATVNAYAWNVANGEMWVAGTDVAGSVRGLETRASRTGVYVTGETGYSQITINAIMGGTFNGNPTSRTAGITMIAAIDPALSSYSGSIITLNATNIVATSSISGTSIGLTSSVPVILSTNNAFIEGKTSGGLQRAIIGINSSNLVAIDNAGLGATFGGTLSSAGLLTVSVPTANHVAAFNSNNADGGYVSWLRSSSTMGYIGVSRSIMGSGYSASDFMVYGGNNLDLRAANGVIRLSGPDSTANRVKLVSGLTAVLSGNELVGLDFESSDGSASGTGVVAQIYTVAAASFTGGTRSTDLVFATASGTSVDERMRLSSTGDLTLSPASAVFTLSGGTNPVIAFTAQDGTIRSNHSLKFMIDNDNNSPGEMFFWRGSGAATNLMTLSRSGVLTVSGFGTHTFSAGGATTNSLKVENTTSGTTAYATFQLAAGTTNAALYALSQGYTTNQYDWAAGLTVTNSGAGGISIAATHASGEIRTYVAGGTAVQRIDSNGDWRPEADNTRRVGLATHRYTLIRGVTITSGDLQFENGFTFTEHDKVGIAEPGIALLDPDGEIVAFFGRQSMRGKGRSGEADIDTLPYVKTTAAERAQMDAHPELRVAGYLEDGTPLYRTAAERPMPDPKTGKTNRERKPAPTLPALRNAGGQQ